MRILKQELCSAMLYSEGGDFRGNQRGGEKCDREREETLGWMPHLLRVRVDVG